MKKVQIIAIHSYKGGTGKSSIALNLADLLAQTARTLLIEANYFNPILKSLNQFSSAKHTFLSLLEQNVLLGDVIHCTGNENLWAIISDPINSPLEDPFLIKGRDFTLDFHQNISQQIHEVLNPRFAQKEVFSFVVIDLPPGIHPLNAVLLSISHLTCIVTRPHIGVLAANMWHIYSLLLSNNKIIIWNQVPTEGSMIESIEQVIRNNNQINGLEPSIKIPYNDHYAIGAAKGKIIDQKLQKYLTPLINWINSNLLR